MKPINQKYSTCKKLCRVVVWCFLQVSFLSAELIYSSPDYNPLNRKKGCVAIFDRNSEKLIYEEIPAYKLANFLHNNFLGKMLLPIFKSKIAADIYNWWNNRGFSRKNIDRYVKKYSIDLDDFLPPNGVKYNCFNDFFTRSLSTKGFAARQPDYASNIFISPADSKLFVMANLNAGDNFWLKESDFDLANFVGQDAKLIKKFEDGLLMIFRLAPQDYHHFHAPTDVIINRVTKLGKELESVSPIAYNKGRKPLIKNRRLLIECFNEQIGDFLIVPVGAMMVGKIRLTDKKTLLKGEELGFFEFGGSTVVCLLPKGVLLPEVSFLQHSMQSFETKVLMGDTVGKIISQQENT